MEPTRLYPILSILALLTVAWGGWALLTYLTGRDGLTGAQQRFFRAGHAHAGVLIILSLVYFSYLDDTSFSETLQWVAGGVISVGIPLQAGGFFLHLMADDLGSSSAGTRMTRTGGLLIGAALLMLAIGLATE